MKPEAAQEWARAELVSYNYHRPHGAADGQGPATRLWSRVTNVQPSYI